MRQADLAAAAGCVGQAQVVVGLGAGSLPILLLLLGGLRRWQRLRRFIEAQALMLRD